MLAPRFMCKTRNASQHVETPRPVRYGESPMPRSTAAAAAAQPAEKKSEIGVDAGGWDCGGLTPPLA